MKKCLFILLIFFVKLAQAQEPKGLSLEEAIQIGLENNPIIHISEMSVQYAEARAREAGTTLLPSLRVDGSYHRLSDVPEFTLDVPFPDMTADGIEIFPNIVDHYTARISLQQPLFTGFRLQGNRDALKYTAKAERHSHRADKNELEYAIIKAYWNAYRAREAKHVVTASIEQLQEHLHNVENFYEEGLVTRNEVLKVRVQLSNMNVRLIEAGNNVRVATVRLNNLIGLPLHSDIELTSEPQYDLTNSQDIDDYITTAVGDNPEILELESRKQAGASALRVARSGWYPQIYLSGGYYYQRPHQRYLPLRDEFNDSWDIGITLSLDVWNWGATSHRTSQARAQLRQTEYALEKRRDDISVAVMQEYLNVESAREQVEAAKIAMEQAKENYRVTSDLFKEDMVVNADVLNADVALLQAHINYIEALVKYEIAQAGLRKSIGNYECNHSKKFNQKVR